MYSPMFGEFLGNVRGSTFNYGTIPIFMALFHLFWTLAIFDSIVTETNRYATTPLDDSGRIHGGPKWENLIVSGLRAFIALALYMEMKRQPNYKTYWSQDTLFHYPMVANIFTRDRFMALRRCLHVTNQDLYAHIGRGDV